MWDFLQWLSGISIQLVSGFCLYNLFARFAPLKFKWRWHVVLLAVLSVTAAMIIMIGDNNMLLLLPFFLLCCMASTKGDWVGRLAVTLIFFCLVISVNGLLDTHLAVVLSLRVHATHAVTTVVRPCIWCGLYLLLRGHLPKQNFSLSRRLWRLLLGLSAMPLCALIAVVLFTYDRYNSAEVRSLSMNQGIIVLPFVFLTASMLLFTIVVLADHEALEQAHQLAQAREVYYQGLRREQRQVRTLRHDLRNHLTVIQGLLEEGATEKALGYLGEMAGSSALQGTRQLCGNEAANAVLTSKAEVMRSQGLEGDFAVTLPPDLPVADVDLCALLGNALDNAIEAAVQAADKRILVRARADKGLLMLRVENAVAGPLREGPAGFATTKANKTAHGFGLAGMREIAERYGGTLEAGVRNGRFELVACLPLATAPKDPK